MLSKNEIIKIYNMHHKELFHYILKYIGNSNTADELLQDCFERFINYSMKHDIDKTKVRAFLYTTCLNLCKNYYRKNKKFEFYEIDEQREHSEDFEKISLQIEADELQDKINDIVNSLDDSSKSIFIMQKELGLSNEEIAKNLGVSSRTIRRKINNILNKIMEKLKADEFL